MFAAMPDAEPMTGAGVPAHQFTLTGPIWLAGDIFATAHLQPDAGVIRMGDEPLLDLGMLGRDAI